jgi:hypothetical protein
MQWGISINDTVDFTVQGYQYLKILHILKLKFVFAPFSPLFTIAHVSPVLQPLYLGGLVPRKVIQSG